MSGMQPSTAPQQSDRPTRSRSLREAWSQLKATERAATLAWASFTTTFAVTRAITHLIKDESGSSGGGGITIGGKHLHHYNLGILTLSALAGATINRGGKAWEGPAGPILYGVANALIVDEAALLLDLEDVYWGKQGRVSVDAAITTIGAGGVAVAALPLAQKWTGRA